MTTPLPSRRVRGSVTGRPIMALIDLLGRRMALRILWELRDGSLTFRVLQNAAETNPSVLNVRLKELREARLVAHGPAGYGLTPHGSELLRLLLPLHAWADEWAELFAGSGSSEPVGVRNGVRPAGPDPPARRWSDRGRGST